MLDQTEETKIEYLERNIAETRMQRGLLQNKSCIVAFSEEDNRLRKLQQRLTAELHKIRPYKIVKNGPVFIVDFKGMTVFDDAGENWLTFRSVDQAQAWIDETINKGREVTI